MAANGHEVSATRLNPAEVTRPSHAGPDAGATIEPETVTGPPRLDGPWFCAIVEAVTMTLGPCDQIAPPPQPATLPVMVELRTTTAEA